MSQHRVKKERLSIYLVEDHKLPDARIIKIDDTLSPIELSLSPGKSVLYVKNSNPPHLPSWVKFLFSKDDIPDGYFKGNHSEGAVLIYRESEKVFALAFGTGYHLIDRDIVARNFGLRVTLNSVNSDKLRSLDKATYEDNPLNTRQQSPKDADIFDLQIDVENDMLYALTGKSAVELFGGVVTGRDALTIMPESDLNKLPAILSEAHNRWKNKLPEKYAFLDEVGPVLDADTKQLLNWDLQKLLSSESVPTNVWIGEPEIVDWETQLGYAFERGRSAAIHPTLHLSTLLDYLKKEKINPGEEALRSQKIYIFDANYNCIKQWSIYQCLYVEISDGGKTYLLRNGNWHMVSASFVSRIDKTLSTIEKDSTLMPSYAHANEGDYNESCAKSDSSYELLDKKLVQIGNPHDKIEFCDLVRNAKDLIHVKVYRGSATLSHLFAQGSVSALTFFRDAEFRSRLNLRLPKSIRLDNPAERPKTENYRVVYAIATNKDVPKELPFFAKVALKNAVYDLRMLNIDVALSTIAFDPLFIKKSLCKPSKKAA